MLRDGNSVLIRAMVIEMKVTRLYTGPDAESHFEEIDIPLKDAGDIGRLLERIPATGIIFREADGDYHYRWHNAPNRQFIILLEGELKIEVGDGTRRRFGPGNVLLVEDTEGHGHISRALHNQPRKTIFVTLD